MQKVAIVILNYMNYKDTIECVESVNLDNYPSKEIIIVDNGSANESREELEKRYKYDARIHLLLHDNNEGFARGNNLGIRYATDVLGCKFVLIVNNDTIFKDLNMLSTLINAYEPGVGVIGPRIISADGQEQNPAMITVRTKWQQNLYYIKKITNYKQSNWYQCLKKIKISREKKKRQEIARNNRAFTSRTSFDLVLHGACFLLTPDYFKYYPYLFPDTFLYYEEDILTILTRKVRLVKKFVHLTYIFHKEHQSTEMIFEKNDSRKAEYQINSIRMARKIYSLKYEKLMDMYFKL